MFRISIKMFARGEHFKWSIPVLNSYVNTVSAIIIVAFLQNATIGYSSESLCVCLHLPQYKLAGPITQLWYKLRSLY